MHIYVDARLPWGSGIGRYVSSILPEMASLRKDWKFTVGVHETTKVDSSSALAEANNVSFIPIPVSPFSVSEQLSLQKLVPKHDLAWFTNYWVPFFWGGPFVSTVHDVLHLQKDLFPSSVIKRYASYAAMRFLREKARGIIFVSSFSQNEFSRIIGAPEDSIVVHHGADHFREISTDERKSRLALIVSAPKVHKNVETAIQAWVDAAPNDGWRLIVVSPGDELRSKIQFGAETSSVSFKSAVSNSELQSLYEESSLFLFPSRYEGFGFPILEAALSGNRIIASNADALLEVSKGMDICVLHPDDTEGWKEAIKNATSRPPSALTDTDIHLNKDLARSFLWSNAAQKTLGFLESAHGS